MHSAMDLATAILDGRPEAFRKYEQHVIHHLETWQEIVEYFYNGRLFTCFRVGEMLRNTLLVKLTFSHISKHLGRIFQRRGFDFALQRRAAAFCDEVWFENEIQPNSPRDNPATLTRPHFAPFLWRAGSMTEITDHSDR